MSGLWLVPQLSLIGLAEALTSVGQVEFYYKQFPENMRSVAGSFFFLGLAASGYLNGFLVSIVHRTTEGAATGNWLPEDLNKGRLDYFYYLVVALGVVPSCISVSLYFISVVWLHSCALNLVVPVPESFRHMSHQTPGSKLVTSRWSQKLGGE
ncbi:hypothetical protein RJ639_032568 [Escallonia herrerae]|uniref:Uncharacterized protein n=1 Tax=Escallonia herrerae TaxID=1293975 RepID=A0AA88WX87_9ASTE|nr:hypothetical protein RJ639_032568 [Escallonia herrerae]